MKIVTGWDQDVIKLLMNQYKLNYKNNISITMANVRPLKQNMKYDQ